MQIRCFILALALTPAVAFGQARCADAANYYLREDCLRALRDTARTKLLQTIARGLDDLPDSDRQVFIQREVQRADSAGTACRSRFGGLDGDSRMALMECIAAFSDTRRTALASAPSRAAAPSEPRACLTYEPDSTALAGVLEQRTFPGLPNYRSVAQGDQPETGYYLNLTRPFCISRRVDLAHPPVAGIEVVQLWPRDADIGWFRAHVGQLLTVRRTLFHAVTVHHHADVLVSVARP